MILNPLTEHQCNQSLAQTLSDMLFDAQRFSGDIVMSEKDYKDIRMYIFKAIEIVGRYK